MFLLTYKYWLRTYSKPHYKNLQENSYGTSLWFPSCTLCPRPVQPTGTNVLNVFVNDITRQTGSKALGLYCTWKLNNHMMANRVLIHHVTSGAHLWVRKWTPVGSINFTRGSEGFDGRRNIWDTNVLWWRSNTAATNGRKHYCVAAPVSQWPTTIHWQQTNQQPNLHNN